MSTCSLDHRGKVSRTWVGSAPPEDRVQDCSRRRAQGEAGTVHTSLGRSLAAKAGFPGIGGHAPVNEEEKQPEEGERWELPEEQGGCERVLAAPQPQAQAGS